MRRAQVVARGHEHDREEEDDAEQHLLAVLLGHARHQPRHDVRHERRAEPADREHEPDRVGDGQHHLEQVELALEDLQLREEDERDHVVEHRRRDDQLPRRCVEHLAALEHVERDAHRRRR
eukprot:2499662-Prymnesium_polylepis.1